MVLSTQSQGFLPGDTLHIPNLQPGSNVGHAGILLPSKPPGAASMFAVLTHSSALSLVNKGREDITSALCAETVSTSGGGPPQGKSQGVSPAHSGVFPTLKSIKGSNLNIAKYTI